MAQALDRQVEPQGGPPTYANSSPSAEAIGAGQASLLPAANQILQTQTQNWQKEKELNDDTHILQANLEAEKLKTDHLTAALQVHGDAAQELPNTVPDEYVKNLKAVREKLQNDDQRNKFDMLAPKHVTDVYKTVKAHAADEADKTYKDTLGANLELYANKGIDAGVKVDANGNATVDVVQIGTSKAAIANLLVNYAQKYGQSEEVYQKNLLDNLSVMNAGIVNSLIRQGYSAVGMKYMTEHADEIRPDRKEVLDGELRQGLKNDKVFKDWTTVYNSPKYRLGDGNPNEAKISTAVLADPTIAPDQKPEILSKILTMANQNRQQRVEAAAGRWASLSDEANALLDKGASYPQLAALANKYSNGTPTELHAMDDYLQRLTAKDSKGDASAKSLLWENIQLNVPGAGEALKDAFKKHLITASDFNTLQKDLFHVQVTGPNQAYNSTMYKIKLMANDIHGADADGRDAFLNTVRDKFPSKDNPKPEAMMEFANKKLLEEKHVHWWSAGWDGSTRANQAADQQTARNRIVADIGAEQYSALQGGLGPEELKKGGVEGILQSLSETYGADSVKRGGKVNNAIQSLNRYNLTAKKPFKINEKNIRAQLQTSDTGIF